jgi:anti-sigma B factor antagonist
MAETGLVVSVRRQGAAAVVTVRGSAGMGESEQLRAALEQLAASATPLIIMDLSEMDFICSNGLGAIVSVHVKSRRHKGEIRLAGPKPHVRDVLETTRLTQLFGIYASVQQAIDA